jgi:hypothetical protein
MMAEREKMLGALPNNLTQESRRWKHASSAKRRVSAYIEMRRSSFGEHHETQADDDGGAGAGHFPGIR